MSESISVTPAGRPMTCPLCLGALDAARTEACPECATPYHRGCLVELGGCATLGCSRKGVQPVPRDAPPPPAQGLDLRVLVGALGVLATLLVVIGAGWIVVARSGGLASPARAAPPPPPPVVAPPPTAEEVADAKAQADARGTALKAIEEVAGRVRARHALARQLEAVEAGEPIGPEVRDALAAAIGRPDALPELRRLLRVAVGLGADERYVRDLVLGPSAAWGLELVVWSDEPSPLGAQLDARLQAQVARIDGERERVAAAEAYASALQAALDREKLLASSSSVEFVGPDPHEVARAARRRHVAAGGVERPVLSPALRDCDLAVALLAGQVHGVMAAEEGTKTPTERARSR